MTITDSVKNQIQLGIEGKNQGFTTGLDKLDLVTGGIVHSRYLVLTSNPGGGKTALYLYSYVYSPLKDHLEDGMYRGYFFSMDMSAEQVVGRMLSMYIFDTYHVQLSSDQIFSSKKGYILSGKNYEYVQEALKWYEKVEKVWTIYDKNVSAGGLYKRILEDLEKYGHFEESENRKVFIWNDPNMIYVIGIDHVSLLYQANGHSIKEEIDLASNYLKTVRNYGPYIVALQQTNRTQGSMDRRQQGMTNFVLGDLKDSANPSQDCDIVIAAYNPNKDRLNTYKGYDIKKLGGNFRTITTLKHRYGEVDKEFACTFYGNINMFGEIPYPNDIYDYDKYVTPDYLLNNNEDEEEIKEDNTQKQQFKLII